MTKGKDVSAKSVSRTLWPMIYLKIGNCSINFWHYFSYPDPNKWEWQRRHALYIELRIGDWCIYYYHPGYAKYLLKWPGVHYIQLGWPPKYYPAGEAGN